MQSRVHTHKGAATKLQVRWVLRGLRGGRQHRHTQKVVIPAKKGITTRGEARGLCDDRMTCYAIIMMSEQTAYAAFETPHACGAIRPPQPHMAVHAANHDHFKPILIDGPHPPLPQSWPATTTHPPAPLKPTLPSAARRATRGAPPLRHLSPCCPPLCAAAS